MAGTHVGGDRDLTRDWTSSVALQVTPASLLEVQMHDLLHHLFGTCGDAWHPTLSSLFASGFGLFSVWHFLKGIFKR